MFGNFAGGKGGRKALKGDSCPLGPEHVAWGGMSGGSPPGSGEDESMRSQLTTALIHVGQYNILAANLACNMRPWFWYGYRGIKAGTVPVTYMGDSYDALRAEVFGFGRSKQLIQAWGVAKDYFKVFDEEYGYCVNKRRHYTEGHEPPSIVLRHLLQRAVYDFFHRSDQNNPWGNRKLSHHLWDRDSYDYKVLGQVLLRPLGYELEEPQWVEVDRRRRELASLTGDELTAAIREFNGQLRRALVLLRRRMHRHSHHPPHALHDFELSEERAEAEFHEVALELATFLCLSDEDLHRILEHQAQMEWDVRGQQIVQEIRNMSPHLIGLQEVDRVDFLSQGLTPSLRLAAYKHRKVVPADDGSALFFDPQVFSMIDLDQWQQQQQQAAALPQQDRETCANNRAPPSPPGCRPAVACIRFSGEASLKGHPGLRLYRTTLRYSEGRIGAETEQPPGEGEAAVASWAFTCDLTTNNGGPYDERVAVVAALRHHETGGVLLAVNTHLAHSQNAPGPEAVRAFQMKQLELALEAIRKEWGMGEGGAVPVVLMMDGNDTPRLTDYPGRGDGLTPMYETALRLGWHDLLGPDYAPTSITLNRRYRIDYIWAKVAAAAAVSQPACRVEVARPPVPALQVRLVGLDPKTGEKVLVPPEDEEDRAVYGAPLPAVGCQPVVPSDHLHCSCWVRISWDRAAGGSKGSG